VSAPVAKAFAAVLPKQAYVDTMTRNATALGNALANDAAATAKLHAVVHTLAHALAKLGPLPHIKSKPQRQIAYERQGQLEMLAYGLRIAGPANDRALATLATELADGPIRGTLVEVLGGGQISLAPGAFAEVAALFAATADPVVMRCALHAELAHDAARARARWTELLRAAPGATSERDALRVKQVLRAIEASEPDHAGWAPLVYPLATHADRNIALAAGSFLAKQRASFLGYLAWALATPHARAVIDVISEQTYWATLSGVTPADLAAPLAALLARAAELEDSGSVDALTRAVKKIGIELGAAAPVQALGEPLAQVGTEGGPPLVVPAEHLSAWLGVEGPEPFDSGGSDYERACDAQRPSVIQIGDGHGVVLDGQGCNVHAIDHGLLFVANGSPAEEVEQAWKKVGALTVGSDGLVVLDSAEVGKDRGVNRTTVTLASGTYHVWGHTPRGFGGDYSAVRLVRDERAAKPAKATKPASVATATAKSAAATRSGATKPST